MRLEDLKLQLRSIFNYGGIRQYFHATSYPITVGHYSAKKVVYTSSIENFTEQYERACIKVRDFYIQTSYGICECLGKPYDFDIPKEELKLIQKDKGTAPENVIKGGVVGAFLGAMFRIPFAGGALGAALGGNAENKETRYEAASRIFDDYAKRMTDLCVNYFEQIIDEEISKGVEETKIELDLALFYGKRRCPRCGSRLKSINGKNGWFLGCSNKDCNYTSKYVAMPKKKEQPEPLEYSDLPF